MKIESIITITLFFLITQTQTRKPPKPKKAKPGQKLCNQELIQSYLLRGRRFSIKDKNLTCPSIKNNCCGKLDQQRMFHVVNDIIPPKTEEYLSKMKLAMGKIKLFHGYLIKKKGIFAGGDDKKEFCGAKYRKLKNFNFAKFYTKIINAIELVRGGMNEFYQNFFCVICDADNMKFFSVKNKRILVDQLFCRSLLKENKKIIFTFGVLLTKYLQDVQALVDCHHYLNSFDLEFLRPEKVKIKDDLMVCLNRLGGKMFMKSCRDICENLSLSKINPIIEGDFNFLIETVNIFEKFLQMKESGNMISMKLRNYFRRFQIPRKLTLKKKNEFIRKLRMTKTKHVSKGFLKLKQRGIQLLKDEMKLDKKAEKEFKSLYNFEMPKSKKKDDRELSQIITKKTNKAFQTEPELKLGEGRLLANKKKKRGKPDKKKLKYAKLVYDKELDNFYKEISIRFLKEKAFIFHVPKTPIDIENLKKIYVKNSGINPLHYNGLTNFGMKHEKFYLSLFKYRKSDRSDPNLIFFLNDFTKKKKLGVMKILTTPFKMVGKKKKSKKKKGKGKERILSDREWERKNKIEGYQTVEEYRELH